MLCFLLSSYRGVETVTENLAEEFLRLGHKVTIITTTKENGKKQFPFLVLRTPSPKEFWEVYRQCDIFVHQGISLKWVWPLLLRRKPWFIVYHQACYQSGVLGKLKKFCSFFAHNIVVSNFSKEGYKLSRGTVIHNSYNDRVYECRNNSVRNDFVFVGRLIADKGCYLLLDAFEKMKEQTKSTSKLTLIGDSEEGDKIRLYASGLKSKDDIYFIGNKKPLEVAQILNNHAVLVVPSVYREAFGVVVLEGLACGCIVVGSDGDGITEALGDCGINFRKGSTDDLSEKMSLAMNFSEEEVIAYRKKANLHLSRLTLTSTAEKWVAEFERSLNSSRYR